MSRTPTEELAPPPHPAGARDSGRPRAPVGIALPETALAGRIRQLRAHRHENQKNFARRLGISQQRLSDWEHGRRLRPLILALRLAHLLGDGRPAQ